MFLFCQDCADGSDEVNCTDVIDNASAKPILPVPIFPKGNTIYLCIFFKISPIYFTERQKNCISAEDVYF
jgi:hypothetical protein